MYVFKHKLYNKETDSLDLSLDTSNGVVEAYIYASTPPSNDYELATDEMEVITFKALLYKQRKVDGTEYSDLMNARLDSMTTNFFTSDEMTALKSAFSTDEAGVVELAKDEIDTAFQITQVFMEGGKFKSAQREIVKIPVSTFVSQDLIDEIKLFIDNYVNLNY